MRTGRDAHRDKADPDEDGKKPSDHATPPQNRNVRRYATPTQRGSHSIQYLSRFEATAPRTSAAGKGA
ncbi:hypothetical protein GCM10010191_52700 [Actinomadura vinacea]|uniref:DUF397 domain-containing protein n=1 Tax=Actinomadura vinacea TaxID=115336 RepID=A0ABP5WTW3_9ACTN